MWIKISKIVVFLGLGHWSLYNDTVNCNQENLKLSLGNLWQLKLLKYPLFKFLKNNKFKFKFSLVNCLDSEFNCNSGQCIEMYKRLIAWHTITLNTIIELTTLSPFLFTRCNGKTDCEDKSDEADCSIILSGRAGKSSFNEQKIR